MELLFYLLALLFSVAGLAYLRVDGKVWAAASVILLGSLHMFEVISGMFANVCWGVLAVILLILNVGFLRRNLVTKYVFFGLKKVLPEISETEKVAIASGDTWWEGDLFQGNPDWDKLMDMPEISLTAEEQSFMDNQVEVLCKMVDDWKTSHHTLDLDKKVWDYLKKEKFFSMLIPKKYGGLEFSAYANSSIVQKISTKSLTAAVTVMVPNSLGPGELLLHYGTEEQKEKYLTALAVGDEIPCFGLTATESGSDATSMVDRGIICKGKFNGEEVLGVSLTWSKRYITLAPIATLLGLAIKLYDPDGLLGSKKNLGITLFLLPTDTKGVKIGNRHFPLNQPFMNGPTQGENVFVPFDYIIGGKEKIGYGWTMLVECLSAGRGISLPALGAGVSKLCYRTTGAYAKVRNQFNIPIMNFEGIQEAMAEIAGYTYMVEAARLLTLNGIDSGVKPAVVTAICKYHMTEMSRKVISLAMDVHAGRGIMLGPKNYLGRLYEGIPISITVEGANILTRSLIILGQGSIRCHPYLKDEIDALYAESGGLEKFDGLLFKHVRFTLSNLVRLSANSFTNNFFLNYSGKNKYYLKNLTRMSLALSVATDISLLYLGGKFKIAERLSARLGDVLSYLYFASAILKFEQNFNEADEHLFEWSMQTCLYNIQEAFFDFYENFPSKFIALMLKVRTFPLGRKFKKPNDRLSAKIAKGMVTDMKLREALTKECYIGDETEPVGQLDKALELTLKVDPLLKKMKQHVKLKPEFEGLNFLSKLDACQQAGVFNKDEVEQLKEYYQAYFEAIEVDDFEKETLIR